jgi:hypothetical protein
LPTPKAINLVGVCPHCGESVEMTITKKQAKIIWKSFKMEMKDAQLSSEKMLCLDYEKLKKKFL